MNGFVKGLVFTAGALLTGCDSQRIENAKIDTLTYFNQQNQSQVQIPQFTEGYADLENGRLHYVTGGTGKLIVFYHGFPSFWFTWKNQLTELSKDYRVVAVDALGANLSDKPKAIDAYRVENLAKQLNQLVKQLAGDEPFILIGHDWGGALAWSYAQQYPQQLDKLIVFNAPPTNLFVELLRTDKDQQKASRYVARLKSLATENKTGEKVAAKLWQLAYKKHLKNGHISAEDAAHFRKALTYPGALLGGINWYRANIPAIEDINDRDYWPARQASTNIPSLLVWGEEDKTFVPAFMELLPRYASNLKIETIAGVGHSPMLERPEIANRLIKEFIAE